MLAVAEFLDLNTIKIVTVDRPGVGVGSHHGYALLVVAVVGLVMAVGAWRGSRPAAVAVAFLGAVALAIVLVVDLPDVDATGTYGVNFDQARAVAAAGFKLSSAGAVLLLVAGVAGAARRSVRAPASDATAAETARRRGRSGVVLRAGPTNAGPPPFDYRRAL